MKLADLRQSPKKGSVQRKHELIVRKCECYQKVKHGKVSYGYEKGLAGA